MKNSRINKYPMQIYELPLEVSEVILDYLNVRDVDQLNLVSKSYKAWATDDSYWRKRLKKTLRIVLFYPGCDNSYLNDAGIIMKVSSSGQSYKIYKACRGIWIDRCDAPTDCYSGMHKMFSSLVGHFRDSDSARVPQIVFYGPGLERKVNGKMVSSIVDGGNSMFKVRDLVPGAFNGVGSGIRVEYMSDCGRCVFDLITLYSNVRKVREFNQGPDRLAYNRLITQDDNGELVLRPDVNKLFRSADGVLFVVNSNKQMSESVEGREELEMLLRGCNLPTLPIAVAGVRAMPETSHHSSYSLLGELNLKQYENPWMVSQIVSSTLSGIQNGLNWLLYNQLKAT